VGALVALLGLSSFVFTPACSKSASAEPSLATAEAVAPSKVATQPVTARRLPVWLSLTGQLKGSRDADLAANASGKVVKTLVERGAIVKAGQPLVVLDTRAAALNLAEARASAESAAAAAENEQTTCARFRALADKGAISQAEYDGHAVRCRTSDLALSAARARAAMAGQYVGDGVIRAPFAGSIAERYVDVGEFVRADSRVVTLVDLSSMRLEFTLPESQIAAARSGAKVRFSVAGYPNKQFAGTVKYVSAQVRSTTRDVIAEAVVDTPDVDLRPGMFAAVELESGTQEVPVISAQSLLERDGRFVAFVDVNGRLEERIVHVSETLGEEKAITRGIAAGDKLVIAPTHELKNGQRVL
jgi:RND family efflux transporter MFP subunit